MEKEERRHRFEKAIGYLVGRNLIDPNNKVRNIADKMRKHPMTIRFAMKGDERYLNNRFITSFCQVYGNIISPDWISGGVGVMLVEAEALAGDKEIMLPADMENVPRETLIRLVEILFNFYVSQRAKSASERQDIAGAQKDILSILNNC